MNTNKIIDLNYMIVALIIIFSIFYIRMNEKFSTDTQIYIFYHIYCNQYTLEVIKDQINKIIFSGLYDSCNNIYCFLTGEENYINICNDYIKGCGNKFSIEDIGEQDRLHRFYIIGEDIEIENILEDMEFITGLEPPSTDASTETDTEDVNRIDHDAENNIEIVIEENLDIQPPPDS